jgi:large subunit ribosomal protein L10
MFENLPDKLKGQTYLAYLENGESSNEVAVPKSIVKSVEENFSKNFQIYGAVVNGEFFDTKQTINLSKVPSKEDSMAMIAGSISQIISRIALVINEIPSSTARAINEVAKQK